MPHTNGPEGFAVMGLLEQAGRAKGALTVIKPGMP